MSFKFFDGLKLLVWALVVGSCCIALMSVNRPPQSELGAAEIHTVSAAEIPDLLPCESATTAAPETNGSDAAFCAQCACPTESSATCSQATAFVPVPYSTVSGDDSFQPAATHCRAPDCPAPASQVESPNWQAAVNKSVAGGPGCIDAGQDFAQLSPTTIECVQSHSTETPETPSEHPTARPSTCPSNTTCKSDTVLRPTSNNHHETATDCPTPDVIRAAATKTLTMRDESNRAVATLKINSTITHDYMSITERESVFAARDTRNPYNDQPIGGESKPQCTPQVEVQQDSETGLFTIDAQTIEIHQLVKELSTRTGRPIRCHESISGTVSARVTDVSLMRALEKLVSPFGFVLETLDDCTVVGTPDALTYESRRLEDRRALAKSQVAPFGRSSGPAITRTAATRTAITQTAITQTAITRTAATRTAATRADDHRPIGTERGNSAVSKVDSIDLQAV